VYFDDTEVTNIKKECCGKSTWERAAEEALKSRGDFLEILYLLQKQVSGLMPEALKWGRLEPGYDPGILLVKGLEFPAMRFTEKTKLRILNL
jgi:hypothetical protein